MRLGIFAKPTTGPTSPAACRPSPTPASPPPSSTCLWLACPPSRTHPYRSAVIHQIRAAAGHAGIALAAISGTFNAAHPDPAYRQTHLDRFRHLCAAASDLQIDIITLSSGSRDPDDMWRWHPDNTTAQAWADSRTTLQALAALAEDYGLTLAVEPEHSNVVATAEQAIMMLDQVASPALKIVYDAANLLDPDDYDPLHGCQRDHPRHRHPGTAHCTRPRQGAHRPPSPSRPRRRDAALAADRADPVQGRFDGTLVTHGLPETSVPLAVATLSAALAATETP